MEGCSITPVEARNGNDKVIVYELRPSNTEYPWEKFELKPGEAVYIGDGWTAYIGNQKLRRLEINGSEEGGHVKGKGIDKNIEVDEKWIDPTSEITATGRKKP